LRKILEREGGKFLTAGHTGNSGKNAIQREPKPSGPTTPKHGSSAVLKTAYSHSQGPAECGQCASSSLLKITSQNTKKKRTKKSVRGKRRQKNAATTDGLSHKKKQAEQSNHQAISEISGLSRACDALTEKKGKKSHDRGRSEPKNLWDRLGLRSRQAPRAKRKPEARESVSCSPI